VSPDGYILTNAHVVADADEVTVRSLTPEEKDNACVDSGVLVTGVNGPSAEAGVQPGDIVLAINSHRVRSAEELRDSVAKIPERGMAALLVLRNGNQIFIPVRIGKSAK
jgi:serine protease Do